MFRKKKISHLPDLGRHLKRLRQNKKISLIEAEATTKIKIQHLEAMENNRLSALGEPIYAQGFLRHYLDFLGASEKIKMEFLQNIRWRRSLLTNDFSQIDKLKKNPVFITPKILAASGLVIVVLGLAAYIAIAVNNFSRPPLIALDQPMEFKTRYERMSLSGSVEAAAFLKINEEIVPVEQSGRFQQNIKLKNGLNEIELTAANRLNRQTKKLVKILYEPQS